jgi:hypothetical protein
MNSTKKNNATGTHAYAEKSPGLQYIRFAIAK